MRAGTAWIDAVRRLGGADASDSARDLEGRYAEPHRRYHSNVHVETVLDDCARLGGEVRLSAPDRALVAAAACAHDVVYDAVPGADERASAVWARHALAAAGVAAAEVARVEALIMFTLTHTGDGSPAGDVLLDADLAILAVARADYDRYVAGVRHEYAAVPDAGWRTGRAAVLVSLLARDPLYATAPGRTRWEAAARANIARELDGLTGTGS
jgi:predicted metal-dependent HD superfamily phosphohydrolase